MPVGGPCPNGNLLFGRGRWRGGQLVDTFKVSLVISGSSMNSFGNGSTPYLECGCPDLTECPVDTMKCPLFKLENPFTGDDCYFGSACLPPPSPFLGHCETGCPTVCGANETYCDLGTDDQGCPLKGICVPYTGII